MEELQTLTPKSKALLKLISPPDWWLYFSNENPINQ
jgi:hypothetical protein